MFVPKGASQKFPGLKSQGRTWPSGASAYRSCNGIHRGGFEILVRNNPPPDTNPFVALQGRRQMLQPIGFDDDIIVQKCQYITTSLADSGIEGMRFARSSSNT